MFTVALFLNLASLNQQNYDAVRRYDVRYEMVTDLAVSAVYLEKVAVTYDRETEQIRSTDPELARLRDEHRDEEINAVSNAFMARAHQEQFCTQTYDKQIGMVLFDVEDPSVNKRNITISGPGLAVAYNERAEIFEGPDPTADVTPFLGVIPPEQLSGEGVTIGKNRVTIYLPGNTRAEYLLGPDARVSQYSRFDASNNIRRLVTCSNYHPVNGVPMPHLVVEAQFEPNGVIRMMRTWRVVTAVVNGPSVAEKFNIPAEARSDSPLWQTYQARITCP